MSMSSLLGEAGGGEICRRSWGQSGIGNRTLVEGLEGLVGAPLES